MKTNLVTYAVWRCGECGSETRLAVVTVNTQSRKSVTVDAPDQSTPVCDNGHGEMHVGYLDTRTEEQPEA